MSPLPLALFVLVQGPTRVGDQGVLVVRRDSQVVARETFRLLNRGGAAGGWQLEATTRWSGPPPATLTAVIHLAADTTPETLVFTVQTSEGSERITGAPGPGRFTLRYAAPGMERAREVATGSPLVMVDDSVFSPYLVAAWFAIGSGAPVSVVAVVPRRAARTTLTVSDQGTAATLLNRDPAMLHQYLVAGGPGGPVRVWFDPDGRLMKVEMSERGLRAERAPE